MYVENKKKVISAENKAILENWFQNRKENTYATKKDLFELQRETRLEFKAIKKWLYNRRDRNKEAKRLTINKSNYSHDEKCYLMTFFEKKNGYPEAEDYKHMAQNIQRTEKQIKDWFNAQRFKLRLKNI